MDTTTNDRHVALLGAALEYAARGWRVFPCHTPVADGCSCHDPTCETIGKHPRTRHGLKDATCDATTLRRWWRQWSTANIGVATGTPSGVVVLDEDSYKGGDVTRQALEHAYTSLPETVQQLTGGGGIQYFFQAPDADTRNRDEHTLGRGVDFRGNGGYVIVPPSLHRSGRRYTWEITHHPDEMSCAPCPAWLITLCTPAAASSRPLEAGEDIPEGTRNATLFRLGCSLRGRGFMHAAILAALQAINTDQCRPPLPEATVEKIASQCAAYAFVASPNGMPTRQPSPSPSLMTQAVQPWRELLLTKKNGDPTGNIGNIGLILANHPTWAGKFWWDAVRSIAMCDDIPLTDELITTIAHWLHTQERLALTTTRPLRECVMVECHKQPRDLLQLWLHALPPWDGTPRLCMWLCDVAGVRNDLYGQAVSRILPLSMVARAMEPGCLYRYVVILEGPENTGKSTLVHALAGHDWCIDLSQALESKESHMMIQGAWLAEMPELDSLSRTEETRLKAFITLTADTWIPKYSNYRISVPRRTIFVGTTNEDSYLKGQSGNTRYLPIRTSAINVDILHEMREQLFAEALHEYQSVGHNWWCMSDEARGEADAQREQRRVSSVFEADLDTWLEERRFAEYYGDGPAVYSPARDEVTWADIAQWYLKIEREKWKDISLQKQLATTLKILGWTQRVVWRQGKTIRLWMKGLSAFDV